MSLITTPIGFFERKFWNTDYRTAYTHPDDTFKRKDCKLKKIDTELKKLLNYKEDLYFQHNTFEFLRYDLQCNRIPEYYIYEINGVKYKKDIYNWNKIKL